MIEYTWVCIPSIVHIIIMNYVRYSYSKQVMYLLSQMFHADAKTPLFPIGIASLRCTSVYECYSCSN